MTLETELEKAVALIPGIKSELKLESSVSSIYGTVRKTTIEDIKCLETERYNIVVAKLEEDSWPDLREDFAGESRIQWAEWLRVYFTEKGKDDSLHQQATRIIVTRDSSDESRDRKDLWAYNFVAINPIGPTQIEVAWADENGKTGPAYTVDLDSKPELVVDKDGKVTRVFVF